MRRRKSEAEDSNDGAQAVEDVEAVVRAAARSIAERLDTEPAVDDLTHDEEFVTTSGLLVDADVPQETVERLSRASSTIAAAMAHRAIARRESLSDAWLGWAFKRLNDAYACELFFLLEAIERHEQPPLIARVLAKA